jgi:hypothetical protein
VLLLGLPGVTVAAVPAIGSFTCPAPRRPEPDGVPIDPWANGATHTRTGKRHRT